MLKLIKLGILAVAVLATLSSCKNEGNSTDATQTTADAAAAGGFTATPPPPTTPGAAGQVVPTANAQEPATPAAPVGPTTVINFAETEFNFGKVKAGEKVQHIYKFKNTGKEPLVISNAKGSCGCTVPQWPKDPIPVGKDGEIVVEFDSKGKSGQQSKTVTITANTDPPQTLIQIKGEVIADPNDTQAQPNVQVKQ